MSDVVAVALITTAGVIAANFVTYKVSKGQRSVELDRVEAENERLRYQLRDEYRRLRKDAYAEFISTVQTLTLYVRVPPGDEDFERALSEWTTAHSYVLLIGAPSVRDALDPLTEALAQAYTDLSRGDPQRSKGERWQEAMQKRAGLISKTEGALIAIMHADVTQPMLDSGPSSQPLNDRE